MAEKRGDEATTDEHQKRFYLAEAVLGTPHPGREGLSNPLRLHPLQSGEAWAGAAAIRLGIFEHSSIYSRGLSVMQGQGGL